jgi:cell filamentation protein
MKYAGDSGDPYLDRDTGVLRNLLGIKDQAGLDKAESSLSFLRTNELREQAVKGKFDLAHLQEIHRRLFGDVYDWAGQIRQVEIQKGSTAFARQMAIESAARQLFGLLAKERYLQGLDAELFSQRAGHYLGEINVLHPFREGNGRTQREFIGQLAQAAGHRVDWSGISQEYMTQASIDAYNGNSSGLAGLIRAGMAAAVLLTDEDRSIPMKQRLLVMNGQRLVQSEHGGQWATDKVEKAGTIKPGIYNIHLSAQADKTKSHDGVILHADKGSVYQQVGKDFVKHDRANFDKAPEIGSNSSIKYEGDKAVVAPSSIKLGRGLSR